MSISPCLIHMQAIPPSNMGYVSFICMPSLLHTCACHASFKYGLRLIHMYAMPHPYVCHASSICVPCLIHMCAMPHPCACHASFKYGLWLIHLYAMTHSYVCHALFHSKMAEPPPEPNADFSRNHPDFEKQIAAVCHIFFCIFFRCHIHNFTFMESDFGSQHTNSNIHQKQRVVFQIFKRSLYIYTHVNI